MCASGQRLELVVENVEALAGLRILDLRMPVGHAHWIVSEEYEHASAIDDVVADFHSRSWGGTPI